MALSLATSLRTTRATDIVTALGANAKIKFYNGTQPATGGTATTLLGTLIGGATIGTVASGVLTFGAVTQTNSAHVSGTPTWVRFTTSADAFVADINIGTGGMTFTGTIATGVDITLGTSTITEGNL
jgi:hypothetical protein